MNIKYIYRIFCLQQTILIGPASALWYLRMCRPDMFVRRSKTERSWTDWNVGHEPAQSAAAAFPIPFLRKHILYHSTVIIRSNAAQTAMDREFTNFAKTT